MHRPAPARHKRPARSCPAAMPRPGPVPYQCPGRVLSCGNARPGPVPYQCPGQGPVSRPARPHSPVRHAPAFTAVPPCLSRPAVPAARYPFRPLSSRPLTVSRKGGCDLPGRLRRRSGRNLPAITADHGENRNNYDLSRCQAPARARGARPPVPGFPAFPRPRRYLRRNDLATNFPGSGLLSPGKTDKPRMF